jgi:hypothetical protein
VVRHPHLHLMHLLGCDAPGALEVFQHVRHHDRHTPVGAGTAPADATAPESREAAPVGR